MSAPPSTQHPYRAWFGRIVLAAGLATFAFMIWKFDPAAVWAQVSQVGAGILILLPMHICDHMLGAMAWKMTFRAEDARAIPFWTLVKVRVAGDGVNYLTPSGTIAGEFVRLEMLGDLRSAQVKNASVVLAKITQSLAQALFIILGLGFVLWESPGFMHGRQLRHGVDAAGAILVVMCVLVYLLSRKHGFVSRLLPHSLGTMREQVRISLKRHPGRLALSTLFFMAAYAWGAVEAYLICRFMGRPVSAGVALSIEILSNLFDMAAFMVPAKVGVQEASKAAIFKGLGYKASQGLAFGLIRHTRELVWSSAGFLLYALSRRRRRKG